jgi:RNA polymerase sigma factor (sigma-70 family)
MVIITRADLDKVRADLDALPDVEKQLIKQRVAKNIAKLTYREREILKLHFGDDTGYVYTYAEIAHIFNISESSVRRILKRAIQKLTESTKNDE